MGNAFLQESLALGTQPCVYGVYRAGAEGSVDSSLSTGSMPITELSIKEGKTIRLLSVVRVAGGPR